MITTIWINGNIYLYSFLCLSFRIDFFSVNFLIILGIVSSLVRCWSYYYMDNEMVYQRFMRLLLVFIMTMVLLIVSSNLFTALVGWDGLGVTSFLLVVYYKCRKRLGSGMLTALTNRLGDCFLLCSLGLFLLGPDAILCFLLILISITKRAQFPFSSWLPAAIAAPTPVRALVHSSTLVTAGVYVLIRFCGFDMGPLLIIGRWTLLLAGLRACVERDIKKVVALSTLSQLGVMMVSLGARAKSFCFFHILSHACFKSLLFICVGSFIHSLYGTQDYRSYDKISPILLSVLFAVSNLSLIGFLYTRGFFRKDIIVEALYTNEYMSMRILAFLIGIGLTSCYSMKLIKNTLLIGDFGAVGTNTIGGLRWQIKIPLALLGVVRAIFGKWIEGNCSITICVLTMIDKMTILMFVRVGWCLGFRFNNASLRRFLTLTPTIQKVAVAAAAMGRHQINADKGWLAAIPMIPSATLSLTPIIGLGLRVLLLMYYYD